MNQLEQWRLLPQELRDLHQWLLAGPNAAGEMKVPMSIDNGGNVCDGSHSNPNTWLDFEYACECALEHGYGIGCVLTAGDPFTCVDFDVKNANNAPHKPELWTSDDDRRRMEMLVEDLNSYTELSQSGQGVHVWVRANIGAGVKTKGVEVYSQLRFIACTGRVVHDRPIADRQDDLNELVSNMRESQAAGTRAASLDMAEQVDDDETILTRARAAENAAKFQSLWEGEWSALGYPSQSEADLALMAMLAFYSPSDEQCRRLFRQSGLGQRDKAARDDYVDDMLRVVRGRRAAEAAEVQQLRERFRAIGQGVKVDPASLVPPEMTLDLMLAELVFISDGTYAAFRSNPHVRLSAKEMKALLRSCRTSWTQADAKGNVKEVVKETFELWLGSPEKRTVFTVAFDPRESEFCATPSGLPALNLYRPLPHNPPADWQARARPFLDHVAYLVPDAVERERFLDWLAHIEQRPGELPHHGYLMVAKTEGIGRNTLADMLACVWSGHVALSLDLGAVLKDSFTDELSRKFLLVVDEINEGQQNGMWTLAQKLKSFTTAPVRNMNPKYGRRYTEVNCGRLLIFSNHTSALPLRATDRRLNVIENPSEPRSPSYYAALRRALDEPLFVAAVREWFRQRDLSAFNPGARAEMNAAKAAVIDATRSDAEENARELVRAWPSDVITASALARELWGEDYAKHTGQLKHRADEAGIVKWPGGRIRVFGLQERVWVLRRPDYWAHAGGDAVRAALERSHGPSAVPGVPTVPGVRAA